MSAEYKTTKIELEKFENALLSARAAEPADDVHADIHAAMYAGLQSQAEELRQTIQRLDKHRER
jgi:hypothetical protein